ncbi:MAG TPA: AraC family transcriptional regulator, partial [Polyangiaceae bacterium]
MTSSRDEHLLRFRRVLEYIDAHLEEDLNVERLSSVAAYSKFHFHRQFSALFGASVSEYVQLLRLKRGSYELAFREDRKVIEIALTSGYERPEAFARAFKKALGQSPSDFRKQPEWIAWHETYRPLQRVRQEHMKPEDQSKRVKVIEFEETKVALLEHRGDPRRIGDTIRAFIEWRRANHLSPKVSATFNLLYNDPDTTPPEEFRLDLCAATDAPVAGNTAGVVARTIPKGRCAVLRHVGSDDGFREIFRRLYSEWLPSSGEEPRDFPLFVERVRFFPDVPEHEAITDVFL